VYKAVRALGLVAGLAAGRKLLQSSKLHSWPAQGPPHTITPLLSRYLRLKSLTFMSHVNHVIVAVLDALRICPRGMKEVRCAPQNQTLAC
jgi:hypothetical protein